MQRALQLVAMDKTQLAHAQRQLAIGMRLAAVDHHAARAVHRLDAVILAVDLGGVHVVLVMIPVAARLPQVAVHNQRRGNLDVVRLVVDVAPVINQRILERHALGQEEREARTLVAEHEQVHFLADAAMVAAGGLLHQLVVFLQLLAGAERRAADAGEHDVVLVILPVCAGKLGQLKRLERLGIGQVRANAHVDVFALLIEAEHRILRQIADVLDLVGFAALLHQLDRVLAAEHERLDRQVFLDNLRHLRLNRGQILVGELLVAQIDVVIEALLGRRAVSETRLRIQALHRLRENVRGRVADDVQLLVFRALGDMAVVVNNLHNHLLLFFEI